MWPIPRKRRRKSPSSTSSAAAARPLRVRNGLCPRATTPRKPPKFVSGVGVHRGQVSALDQEVPHYDLEEHGYQAERRCPGIVRWRPYQEGTGGAEDLLADPDGPTGCLAVPGSPPGLRQEGAAVLPGTSSWRTASNLGFWIGDFGFWIRFNPQSKMKIQNQASPAGSGEPKARDTPSGWRRFRRRHPASRRGLADTGVS